MSSPLGQQPGGEAERGAHGDDRNYAGLEAEQRGKGWVNTAEKRRASAESAGSFEKGITSGRAGRCVRRLRGAPPAPRRGRAARAYPRGSPRAVTPARERRSEERRVGKGGRTREAPAS